MKELIIADRQTICITLPDGSKATLYFQDDTMLFSATNKADGDPNAYIETNKAADNSVLVRVI